MTRPDPRRIKDFVFRIKNGIKPTPLYAGERPKLPGELIIYDNRTERA